MCNKSNRFDGNESIRRENSKTAGVSRGSAHRIYIGIDDLMQDLASEWITNFVVYLSDLRPEHAPENWQEFSDLIIERATAYWTQTADTLRVMPQVRSDSPATYKTALRELSHCIADAVFSDSVRVQNRITDKRMAEAQVLCRTYLSFHLPNWIPARQRVD